MKSRSTLFASIRSARSLGFKPGSLQTLVLPEERDFSGNVIYPEQQHLVCFIKEVSKQEKYDWYSANRRKPNPQFFSQKLCLVLYEDSVILAIKAWLKPCDYNEEC